METAIGWLKANKRWAFQAFIAVLKRASKSKEGADIASLTEIADQFERLLQKMKELEEVDSKKDRGDQGTLSTCLSRNFSRGTGWGPEEQSTDDWGIARHGAGGSEESSEECKLLQKIDEMRGDKRKHHEMGRLFRKLAVLVKKSQDGELNRSRSGPFRIWSRKTFSRRVGSLGEIKRDVELSTSLRYSVQYSLLASLRGRLCQGGQNSPHPILTYIAR
jgi:hypothetical protein